MDRKFHRRQSGKLMTKSYTRFRFVLFLADIRVAEVDSFHCLKLCKCS
jgi:hypothetical protein